MRSLLVLGVFLVLCSSVFAVESEPATPPVVVKSTHYTVTSFVGEDRAKDTLNLMEALLVRYNQLFLFDLSKLPAKLNVTIYATKADFTKAMEGQTNPVPQDFTFLQYSDPALSTLVCWADPDVRPLAFQGFFQYLWSYLPRTPSWIETGLAYHFWNVTWSGGILDLPPELPFLDSLKTKWETTPLTDLTPVLTGAPANELESWALVSFLLESADPLYSRLLGSILGNLAPAASLETNRLGALQRFQSAKSLSTAASELAAWVSSQSSFNSLLAQGVTKLKEKDAAAAQKLFQKALIQRPSDDQARYYAGLAAYDLKDFATAELIFADTVGKSLPPGLLAYSKGLTAFAQKHWDDAKAHLAVAVSDNEVEYKKLAQAVLDLIK